MLSSRHRLQAILLATSVAIACASAGLAAAQPGCPASDLSLSTVETYTTSAAALDSSSLRNRLRFDLVAGTLNLAYCCALNPTYMNVRDAYDVTGVPPGTPVSLTVEVPVSGEIYDSGGCGGSGCGGGFRVSITHGAEYDEFFYLSPGLYHGARISFSGVARLPLTIVAGQPETLSFEFWARRAVGGSHGANADGRIQFTGLPNGATVISCQGFAGQVTPVRRGSWGALKTVYR